MGAWGSKALVWLGNLKIPPLVLVLFWFLTIWKVWKTGWIRAAWGAAKGYVRSTS